MVRLCAATFSETKAAAAERQLADNAGAWERFTKYVEVRGPDECWEWKGTKATNGYGHVWFGATIAAHRAAYIIKRGPIPAGHVICHHCDNKLCVNPWHLFAGTQQENIRDMMKKGRGKWPGPKGARQHLAKLNDEAVSAIRERARSGEFMGVLAREYGVSKNTVELAARGVTWKHVSTPPYVSRR